MKGTVARGCAIALGLALALMGSAFVAPAAMATPLAADRGSTPTEGLLTPPTSAADLWKQASVVTRQGASIAAAAKDGAQELATAQSQLRANVRHLRAIIRILELAPSTPDPGSAGSADPADRIHRALLGEFTGVTAAQASLTSADRTLRQTDLRLKGLSGSLESLELFASTAPGLPSHGANSLSAFRARLQRWQRWTSSERTYVDGLRQQMALRQGQLDAVRRALDVVWQRLPLSLQSRFTSELPGERPSGLPTGATVTYSGTGCVQSIHSGVRLSDVAIATYAAQAGFRHFDLAVAVAISLAESGGDPRAVCVDTNGSRDEGLWQINSVHRYPPSCTFDPSCSAAVAYRLYLGRGKGFDDWVTYSSDRFLAYLPRAAEAAAVVQVRP